MDPQDRAVVVQGNTAFAVDLYRRLKREPGNLLFSPYSISVALAMTYAGARGNTERQMAHALDFRLDQERLHPAFALLQSGLEDVQGQGAILLRVANALWPHVGYPFLEGYLALVKEAYGVLITPVDYRVPEVARRQINAWVEDKTENKIAELIGPGILTDLTRLVLVNAIYFKGGWASQFDRTMTHTASFWATRDQTVEVPMMTQTQTFGYAEREGLQVLELPYAGDDLSMVVLLPREVDGLAALEDDLTVENLEKWTGDLWEQEVDVYLPRFKMGSGFRLDGVLKSMGMTDAFDMDRADFSGMDGLDKGLYIAAVLHKAFAEVNEEGTEAAAATAVVMTLRALPVPPPTFRADHPFLFLIREKRTGTILFLGRAVNPQAGAA